MEVQYRTADDGVRIYGKWLLFFYDLLIMKILSPYVWRCPSRLYLDLCHSSMSKNHADIGVGTGYCLDRCTYEPGDVRIALIDLQQNCLQHTSKRIARYKPECYQRNVMEPVHIDGGQFDSIALGGILHCIPGDMGDKGQVFDSLKYISTNNTRIFGYTILNQGIEKTVLSRSIYFILQKLKVINGLNDSPEQLLSELKKRFDCCEVKVIGCVALFTAKNTTHSFV